MPELDAALCTLRPRDLTPRLSSLPQ